MVKTRKHSRRSVATRKQHRRRRIGGGLDEIEELIDTPFGLVKVLQLLRANIEGKLNDKEKKETYEMIKLVYKKTLSKMKAREWYELILKTHTKPGLASPPNASQIEKRINDAEIVMRTWLTWKREKANKNYYLNRTKEEKAKKKGEALQAFKEFFFFLKGYSERNPQYKELVERNTEILTGVYGQNIVSLDNGVYTGSANTPDTNTPF